ncbi:galactosylceramide sulfotransferase-like [Antedon mediterranea]|uniref:galactosylceramide sulfotransferase-like n=1 Tax=Antedon mediterranea TaxID=105859 RepID=UPI003AF59F10
MVIITKKKCLVGTTLLFIIIYCTIRTFNDSVRKISLYENSNSKSRLKQLWYMVQEEAVAHQQDVKPDFKPYFVRNATLNKGNSTVSKKLVEKQQQASASQTLNASLPKTQARPLTQQQCNPRKNIAFFKMHKCSSSTVQNILFRYGDEHNLNFVLPLQGNYLGYGLFDKHHIRPFNTKYYNILCHHTRFSYKGMLEVLPPDAVFVTILRDPVTMFESMFTYSKYDSLYKLTQYDDPLGQFLTNPNSYYESHGSKEHAKDPMLSDLGLLLDQKNNQDKIDSMILELSEQFNLVMITEYFDESLILLKELMCWDFDDIVYFVLNARAQESVRDVSEKNAIKLREWNKGDVKLYNHFNKTFWEKIELFGKDRMSKEVEKLLKRKQYFEDLCIESVVENDKRVWHPGGIKVESFRLKPSAFKNVVCNRLVRTELPYTDFLKRKQILKFKTFVVDD